MRHIKSFNDANKALQELEITLNKLNKSLGIIAAVQTSSLSFNDNNTSLMTSAAIADKIESYGYVSGTLTDEQVQDKVGAMFSGNTESLITATYQDADGTIDLAVDNDLSNYDNSSSGFITSTLTTEQVQDIVGDMFSSNTETRIAATYVDGGVGAGKINLVVDDMTADTNTQNTTTLSFVDSSNDIILRNTTGGAGSGTDDIKFVAGSNITLTHTDADNITIASTDTNTTYTVGDGGLTQNNFTDADHTKLNGIEDNATADQTQSDINALGITEVGTITSGVWTGTPIADANIASASTWNSLVSNATHTGDVTGATSLTIANDAVTYAKMQNITDNRVLGRYDAGSSGNIKELDASEIRGMIGVSSGANANVKSNWNESDSNSDAFIQNKPNVQYTSAIPTGNNGLVPAAGSAGEFLKHDGTFGTPSYIANTDVDVSVTNLEARLAEIDNSVTYIGATQNDDIQPRGEVRFAHSASFVEQPADSFLIATHYVSWDQGNKYNLTLQGANINFLTHPYGACNLLLKLTQPASGSTFTSITWTADGSDTILWPSGTAPTLSSANGAVDIISFYFDGTSKYYGVASLNFS